MSRASAEDEPCPEGPSDLHSRLVNSAVGRWAVGMMLVVGTVWIALPNMPASPMRDRIDAVWAPATEIGLVQDWAVFSPNPRSQSLDVRAEIKLESGEVVMWDVPEFDPIVGAFRQYRWKKWQERVRLDARTDLWGPTVDWLRREYPNAARVTLIRRWIDHKPLNEFGVSDSPSIGWNGFRFCTWPDGSDGDTRSCS